MPAVILGWVLHLLVRSTEHSSPLPPPPTVWLEPLFCAIPSAQGSRVNNPGTQITVNSAVHPRWTGAIINNRFQGIEGQRWYLGVTCSNQEGPQATDVSFPTASLPYVTNARCHSSGCNPLSNSSRNAWPAADLLLYRRMTGQLAGLERWVILHGLMVTERDLGPRPERRWRRVCNVDFCCRHPVFGILTINLCIISVKRACPLDWVGTQREHHCWAGHRSRARLQLRLWDRLKRSWRDVMYSQRY